MTPELCHLSAWTYIERSYKFSFEFPFQKLLVDKLVKNLLAFNKPPIRFCDHKSPPLDSEFYCFTNNFSIYFPSMLRSFKLFSPSILYLSVTRINFTWKWSNDDLTRTITLTCISSHFCLLFRTLQWHLQQFLPVFTAADMNLTLNNLNNTIRLSWGDWRHKSGNLYRKGWFISSLCRTVTDTANVIRIFHADVKHVIAIYLHLFETTSGRIRQRPAKIRCRSTVTVSSLREEKMNYVKSGQYNKICNFYFASYWNGIQTT